MTASHSGSTPIDSQDESSNRVYPAPTPQPLVPASEYPPSRHPVRDLDDARVDALEMRAEAIAEQSPGTTERHLMGKVGEDAVAKYLDVRQTVDTAVYADGGDEGIDLQYQGDTIDVKTVRGADDDLTVDANGELTADYYVLAQLLGPCSVRLLGYAPVELIQSSPALGRGSRKHYRIPQDRLYPLLDW